MRGRALVFSRILPYLPVALLLAVLAAALILGPLDLMRDVMVEEGGVTERTVLLLLLVPVGATVVVVLRTLVGLDTFGVFAPMILALTFLTVGIVVGLAVLGALILVGTAARLLLERYPSLAVSRAGIIVSLAALVLFGVTFIGSAEGDTELLQAGAFPLVITAGIIERFTGAQMDQDPKEAARILLFTVISSVVVWGVISAGPVQAVLRSRPDLILLSFPALVLMGRYTGLRLGELIRFREVASHARV
ncbi:hypothetical protein LCGC14_2778770 [marine sediment metagenome]|uniref:7 transmembrane helices usually fused to an inactive transglutaminase domain-containing protein n=1 Tax=marine sediment metagenome TaxID=412755 RepID=A0A0F9BKK7_9ZZZZ